MTAETGISFSTDPGFRLFLRPGMTTGLSAEASDAKGNTWTESLALQ